VAYQAHSRRVSASKAAVQQQQQRQHQQEKQVQEHKKAENIVSQENNNNNNNNNALPLPCGCPPSYESSAYDLRPDLEPALPVDLRQHKPKRSVQQPHSAPAVLPSTSKKMAIAQGEIPIGIEPSLSPSANTEIDC
jgi:hypothetical protein